jgi:hypothetical protein
MRPLLDGGTLGGRVDHMITKTDMMGSMLVACPSFQPVWDGFLTEWSTEEEKPLYLALASLARHFVELLAARQEPALFRAFTVVERWHVEGDAYVREAATIGLLEGLQNDSLHTSTSPKQIEPFLMPESLKWWRKVDGFWTNGTPISD